MRKYAIIILLSIVVLAPNIYANVNVGSNVSANFDENTDEDDIDEEDEENEEDDEENSTAYVYHISNSLETQLSCWVGWKKYHYGETTVLAKKGQEFAFPGSPYITRHNNVSVFHEGEPYTATTNGYGYYSLEFSKHVLGFLAYVRDKINDIGDYKTNYVPSGNTLVEYTPNSDGTVKLSDALNIAINDMVSNNYHESYENGEFVRFWDNTLLPAYEEKYKELQNKFYWKAYGYNAYRLLVQMMGAYHDNLDDDEKKVLKGMVFSIMEARYRNKNVQGKMNLEVKASEGELWPFLVNLENLKSIAYDKNNDRYIDTSKNETYYKWPDFEKIVEGAYQWMLYYDADTIRTTSHRTITKVTSTNEDSDNEVEVDWEGEFCELTWQYLPALSGKELENFYSNCQLVKSIFKKSKENTEGIFGAEELYDITSDKNFSEAIRDMKEAIREFCDNKTIDSVWTGLTDYNIERTYIMAKNIVETNKVNDEFAYYNIGTNILTYTYGRHGKEYLLMDFQRVALEEPLKDKYDAWTNKDTDRDGILDRNELGDDSSSDESSMWAKVDITSFIKKMVEKELYGNDTESINSTNGKQIVNTALAQVKYNVYKERQDFLTEHEDDNICDRREDKENYLNIDAVTEGRVNGKTDNEIKAIMKENSAKLQVRLWKYKSNPVLKDTDFDGLDDNIDKVPKDNYFTGRMHTTRISGDNAIEVDMNMDYRYFFMSNKLYYDELSTMSLLYANSIYRQGTQQTMHSGLQVRSANNFINENEPYSKKGVQRMNIDKFKNLPVKEMMEHFGFQNVVTYYMGERGDGSNEDPADNSDYCMGYKDTHKGRVAIGYRNVEYHGLTKTVIGIVIRGTAEDDDWDSDFDMGDIRIKELSNPIQDSDLKELGYDTQYREELNHFIGGYDYWITHYHHAGFDIVSNRILGVIGEYITEYKSNFEKDRCFWVTGHSMGAGVANLVSAYLLKGYGAYGGNRDNVYCYTYASPNTFYSTDNDESAEPHGVKYRCIFNIVNDDDFVPKLPMEECEWTRYGRVAIKSLNDIIHNEKGLSLTVYNYKIRHEFDEYAMSSLITSNERFLYSVYNGNCIIVDKVIEEFSNIYVNKMNDMRRDTYTYNNDYEYYENASFDSIMRDIAGYNKYSLPYLKREKDGHRIKLVQMPAYFMNVVAGGMHNNNNNGEVRTFPILNRAQIKYTQLAKRYVAARDQLVNSNSKIEKPHYLESYYILTKEINTTDFR